MKRIRLGLIGCGSMMAEHVKILYGEIPDDLETFALLSQIYQGEAVKYQIERCRMQKWNKTGILWWNMLDGWPQISDAVVDYYFRRKLAYFYIRRVQVPVLAMIGDLTGRTHPVCIANDTFASAQVDLTVTDADTDETVFAGTFTVAANSTERVGTIPGCVSEKRMLLLRFTVNGKPFGNHFLTGMPPYSPTDMQRWLEKLRLLPAPFTYEP